MKQFAYTRRRRNPAPGVNDSWILSFHAVGKGNDASPYLMANEWIAANVAWILGLPVPPFLIGTSKSKKHRMFGSIRFQINTGPLDLDEHGMVAALPDDCTGALLFDILIANGDRHRGNVKVDDPTRPQELYLFDHDLCMFHGTAGEGVNRLRSVKGKLGVEGGKIDNRDCFLDAVKDESTFEPWFKKIQRVPPWFYEQVCMDAMKLGINGVEAATAVDFLTERAKTIDELVFTHKAEFKGVQWGLFNCPTLDSSSQSTFEI